METKDKAIEELLNEAKKECFPRDREEIKKEYIKFGMIRYFELLYGEETQKNGRK